MTTIAITIGILLLIAATIAYSVYRFAQKHEPASNEHHAPESECDRRVMIITVADEHLTIK